MNKLRKRWGISSNWQITVIFIVFAITGSASAKIAGPIVEFLGMTKDNTNLWIYWPVRLLLIFPIYQVFLVSFGWLFGQFEFFWSFEKKMLKRMGLSKFIND